MSGLYQKASMVRNNEKDSKQEEDYLTFDKESGISPEDQKDIISEIDKIATKSRMHITPEVFSIKAVKKGILFPFMVNLFSIIILAAGVFSLYYFFHDKGTLLMDKGKAIQTPGGKLIEDLKHESEARLKEKMKEISNIQINLEEIDKERNELLSNIDSKIREKEIELRKSLDIELEEERAKLRQKGISEKDINALLNKIEVEKSIEYNKELDILKKNAEEDKIRVEENINNLQEEFKKTLALASEEKNNILIESKKKEEELKSRQEEETKKLETEKSEIEHELRLISDQSKKEELVNNQLIGFYNTVKQNIDDKNFDSAIHNLTNIKNYLNEESILNLPGVLKRRGIDFFVIDSLTSLVESESTKEEIDTSSLIASANLITEIKDMVLEADSLFSAGELDKAEKLYIESLSLIPEINKSHNYFITNKQESEIDRQKHLKEYMTKAEIEFHRNRYSEAIKNYTKALTYLYLPEDKEVIERMISQVKKSGFIMGNENLKKEDSINSAVPLSKADKLLKDEKYIEAIAAYIDIISHFPNSNSINSALSGIKNCIETSNKTIDYSRTAQQEKTKQKIYELEKDLKTKVSELKRLQNDKKVMTREVESLTQELENINKYQSVAGSTDINDKNIRKEMERLSKIEKHYIKIKEDYRLYASKEDKIFRHKGNAGIVETKRYLDSFLSLTVVEEIFPRFWERIKKYDRAFEQVGRTDSIQDITDIIYELSLYDKPEQRTKYLNSEISKNQGNKLKIELLNELKQLITK